MAPGRPRGFDPDEVLDRALNVFWTRGYEGASLSELTAAMGINRPSLYAAFGDKEQLFRRVLERYGCGPAAFYGCALELPTARAVVEALLREGARALTDPDYPAGCLAVHGALACGSEGAGVRGTLTALRNENEARLRERLQRAIDDGDLPSGTEAARLAKYIAVVFQGMAVQAAGGTPRADLDAVADLVLSHWPPAGAPAAAPDVRTGPPGRAADP